MAKPEASASSGPSVDESKRLRKPLLWIDCEMTGLDPSRDVILEIACILTDGSLETVVEGPSMVLSFNLPSEESSSKPAFSIDPWVMETHSRSGLWKACSESRWSARDAESAILAFLKNHGIRQRECVLAGNSVHVDKLFLAKQLPELVSFLHYRIVDVSTIKELWSAWRPSDPAFSKRASHRAIDDIRESISELAFYKKNFFSLTEGRAVPASDEASP